MCIRILWCRLKFFKKYFSVYSLLIHTCTLFSIHTHLHLYKNFQIYIYDYIWGNMYVCIYIRDTGRITLSWSCTVDLIRKKLELICSAEGEQYYFQMKLFGRRLMVPRQIKIDLQNFVTIDLPKCIGLLINKQFPFILQFSQCVTLNSCLRARIVGWPLNEWFLCNFAIFNFFSYRYSDENIRYWGKF